VQQTATMRTAPWRECAAVFHMQFMACTKCHTLTAGPFVYEHVRSRPKDALPAISLTRNESRLLTQAK